MLPANSEASGIATYPSTKQRLCWTPAFPMEEAVLFLLCRVSPACPSAVLCLGQEFPGGEHYKFLKCPVLSGPVYKEASLENVAKLNFQFLIEL